ncbi:MAG: hypothetical protein KGL43_00820 [Burkholderiales bacterium]|nr:hypothetical protein [Burkholderiales bacterium]
METRAAPAWTTSADAADRPARLHIHAQARPVPPPIPLARRWRDALRAIGGWTRHANPLSLHIEDLGGHRVFALDEAGASTEVALSAGTYFISARRGETRRGYTVRLEAGTAFDLYLQLD